MSPITHRSLDAWVDLLDDPSWPVLGATALRLEELREQEDALGNVSAHMLAEDLGGDPLLLLKVLAGVSPGCAARGATPPETLLGAILMLGIGPIFRLLPPQPTTEVALADHPGALAGIERVLARSRQAAWWARQFASHLGDADADIIHDAALLHDFVEILLWWKAPDVALTLETHLRADPQLRSAVEQQRLLGTPLNDIQAALLQRWHLPELLVHCAGDAPTPEQALAQGQFQPQVRVVALAVRLARHTQYGWDDPHATASRDVDISDVAELLNLSQEAALAKVMPTPDV